MNLEGCIHIGLTWKSIQESLESKSKRNSRSSTSERRSQLNKDSGTNENRDGRGPPDSGKGFLWKARDDPRRVSNVPLLVLMALGLGP